MNTKLFSRPQRIVLGLKSIASPQVRYYTTQKTFVEQYTIRSSLENLINDYAQKPIEPLSLNGLIKSSQNLDDTKILQHARDTIDLLLAYNARRLNEFRNLPYLVVLNPSIAENYDLYLSSMRDLLVSPPPKTLAENDVLVETLSKFIDDHADTLPSLSKGFQEIVDLYEPKKSFEFLNKHLRERIAMRLVARQHVSLTNPPTSTSLGVIDTNLKISHLVHRCSEFVNDMCELKYDQRVPINIDNGENIVFPYIPSHLEYILTELFKNSFRAHIENKVFKEVEVTIVKNNEGVEIRIRDRGKGIPPSVLPNMFDFSFTTYESGEGEAYKTLNVPPGEAGNTVAGMGYGLPLSRAYVEMFNGFLNVQTYWGWGTDVYIKLHGPDLDHIHDL